MESTNLDLIIGKKISAAWLGGGVYISFSFGKIRTLKLKHKLNDTFIELDQPEISFNIEGSWIFTRNHNTILWLDPDKDFPDLANEINEFFKTSFPPHQVSIDSYKTSADETTVFFSNGIELTMDNYDHEIDRDNWYLILDSPDKNQ